MMVWISMISWALALNCSVGSEQYTHLTDLFYKPRLTQEDSFLNAYRSYKKLKVLPGLQHLIPNPELDPKCVEVSMQRVPNIAAKRKVCESSVASGQTVRIRGVTPSTKFSNSDKIIPMDMCLDDDMIDYIDWGFSQAIQCVNSLPTIQSKGAQLNPISIFEIFNAESAFGFYLYSNRGQGVGQLTTDGVSDFLPGERFEFLLDEIRNSLHASCQAFQTIVKKPILLAGSQNRKSIRHCQFLSVSEGVGRNLLYSTLHIITKEFDVLAELNKRNYNHVDRKIIDQLIFIAYSRHGMDGVRNIVAIGLPLDKMKSDVFYKTVSGKYPYLKEVRTKTQDFIRTYNQYTGSKATFEDFENGLCKY